MDQAIKDFEEAYPGFRWSISSSAFIDGRWQGPRLRSLIVHHLISSGGGPRWYVFFDRDMPVSEAFDQMKDYIKRVPHGGD
jgi:hypothetical protein